MPAEDHWLVQAGEFSRRRMEAREQFSAIDIPVLAGSRARARQLLEGLTSFKVQISGGANTDFTMSFVDELLLIFVVSGEYQTVFVQCSDPLKKALLERAEVYFCQVDFR